MSVTVMSSTFHRRRSKPLKKRQFDSAERSGPTVSSAGFNAMIVENCAARAPELFEMIRIVLRRAASKDSHVLDHRHILS
jgi:hypothetical protein